MAGVLGGVLPPLRRVGPRGELVERRARPRATGVRGLGHRSAQAGASRRATRSQRRRDGRAPTPAPAGAGGLLAAEARVVLDRRRAAPPAAVRAAAAAARPSPAESDRCARRRRAAPRAATAPQHEPGRGEVRARRRPRPASAGGTRPSPGGGGPGRLVVMRIDSASNVSVTSTPAGSGRSGGRRPRVGRHHVEARVVGEDEDGAVGRLAREPVEGLVAPPAAGERTGAKARGST